MPEVISREKAMALGLVTYNGTPCKHGHDGTRYTKGGCRACVIERSAKRQRWLTATSEEYRAKTLAYRKKYNLEHPRVGPLWRERTKKYEERRNAKRREDRAARTPRILECLRCGEPNSHRSAKYCSKRCGGIARTNRINLDPELRSHKNSLARASAARHLEGRRLDAKNKYQKVKNDPLLLAKRRQYRRTHDLSKQAAYRAIKKMGIKVEAVAGYSASEGRYIAAFRALRELGIEF